MTRLSLEVPKNLAAKLPSESIDGSPSRCTAHCRTHIPGWEGERCQRGQTAILSERSMGSVERTASLRGDGCGPAAPRQAAGADIGINPPACQRGWGNRPRWRWAGTRVRRRQALSRAEGAAAPVAHDHHDRGRRKVPPHARAHETSRKRSIRLCRARNRRRDLAFRSEPGSRGHRSSVPPKRSRRVYIFVSATQLECRPSLLPRPPCRRRGKLL